MRKKITKLISLLIVLLITPVIFLFVLSKVHHKTTHNEIIDFINKELDGKVTFQEFSLSYLRHFPRVHINLQDISFKDETNEVAKIGNLDLLLNLKNFWKRKLNIEGLIINDGEIHLMVDSLGNKAHIFGNKNKSSGSSPGALLINADNIRILNSRLHFANEIKGNRSYIYIKESQLDLITQDSLILIKGSLEGQLDSLISNNTLLFKGQPVEGREAVFTINRYSGEKILQEGYLMAHTLKLEPRFKMKPHKDGQLIELFISGEDNFNDVLSLFEFHTGINLIQVNPEAKLKIFYNQNGFVNPFLRPYNELDFEISNAEFTGEELPFPLKVGGIKGNYNNGEGHSPETVELQIDTIHVEVSESFINGRFKLTNLKDPIVDAHFISQLDMNHLIKQNENISISGTIDADLVLDGKISELKKLHFKGKQQAKGSIEVKNLELVLNDKGYKIELIKGTSLLNNHIFEVTSLVGAFNESAFHFQGNFENLDEYILEDKKNLTGKFTLNFDKLDLRKLNLKSEEKKPDKKSGGMLPLENMALEFSVNGKEVVTEIGSIKNLRLNSRIENQALHIKTMDFLYQDGSVKGSGKILFNEQGIDSVIASINGKFQNLNIKIPETENTLKDSPGKPFRFPSFMNADIDMEIVHGEIKDEQFKNFILQANIKGPEVIVQKFNVDALDGNTNITCRFLFGEAGLTGLWADAGFHFVRIDVKSILNKFDKEDSISTTNGFWQIPQEMDVRINFSSKEIVYRDATISNFQSNIHATEHQIEIMDLYSDLPFGNIQMDLLVSDYQNDKINYNGDVNFSIDSLDVNKLLKMKALGIPAQKFKRQEPATSNKKNLLLALPDNINLKLNTSAKYISYKNAIVEDLILQITSNNEKLDLEKLDYKFAGGSMKIHGHLLRGEPNSNQGYLYSIADEIDIREFFNSFDNFGQDVFNVENTSGKISWASHYYFSLDKDFKLTKDDNLWLINAIVHHAEFDKVEPIEKTLFFVGHKSKDKMIVNKLDVKAFIYGSKIYFSDVLMNDNIANLDVFGEVDLNEKELDLGLEISLSDLFFRSKKERLVETQEGVVNLDKDAKLFLRMTGPFSDHKLKMISKRKFNKNREYLLDDIKTAEGEYRKKQIK